MTPEWLLILLSSVIAVLALCVSVVFSYLYFSQKGQTLQLLKEQVLNRERELVAIRIEEREIAQKEALAQLQVWRGQELDLARKQEIEIARREAQLQFEQWKTANTREIRQDAIQKSQSVTIGKITEHLVPFLPGFSYNPKDARFLGSPIDFVIFDGLDEGKVNNIVIAEIKTGSSSLSVREQQIKETIQAGRVQWIEIRPELNISSEDIGESEERIVPETALTTEAETNVQSTHNQKSTPNRLRRIMKE